MPVSPAKTAALAKLPLFYWGVWFGCLGIGVYLLAMIMSLVRLLLLQGTLFAPEIGKLLWLSGLPITIGILLMASDLGMMLPSKRRMARRALDPLPDPPVFTVALTAYNDEASIASAVEEFSKHPMVRRVIVISNNSTDHTLERAQQAGAIAHNEPTQGYGACVYRCFQEALKYEDTKLIVLCEGDMTFRADDLDKFLAYMRHADIVNGTRIVEQLRDYSTQLSTFMYYGNFFVGKLLEAKHLGRGTFTDVGTTYKVIRRDSLAALLPSLDPRVNLEFNAHFLDRALEGGWMIVECPVTFHPRVGQSKGGNVSNSRALKVGLRMILGLSFGWEHRPVMGDSNYHETRFAFDNRREVLWRSLWKYCFSKYISASDCVVDLGSGYGHFINNVQARLRIAIDSWPGFVNHLAKGVDGHVGDATDLSFLPDGSVDFAFASNLVEHLPQDSFDILLAHLRRKLAAGGRLALLQPNYRYAFREYFDDYSHVAVYSHVSLCDFLNSRGFEILECVPRFMPLTIKSRFKVWPFLIWLYLRSPVKPLGKQMLIVARPIPGYRDSNSE